VLLQIEILINYSFQLVWIILQLIVAIFLSIKMFKTKRYNLTPLILFFLINSLRLIFYLTPSLFIIFLVIIQFIDVLVVIFVKLTFFKGRKSLFPFFLLGLIIVRFFDFIIRLNFQISVPMTHVLVESNLIFYYYIVFSITYTFLVSHFWLGYVALKYYNSIKSASIEPWIKRRYQIIGFGSLVYGLSIFIIYLIPYDVIGTYSFPNIIYNYITLFFTLYYSLSMFIAWIMPNWLKKKFNKGFELIKDEEYSENELLELIKQQLKEN
jgi:hypothetical protein